MILFILSFELKEALEKWLVDCNGHAIDDGVIEGGGQHGGVEEGGVVEDGNPFDIGF